MEIEDHYAAWQSRLADWFLSDPDRPVVFFVDDDELEKIRPADLDPVASLRLAVQANIDLDRGLEMFGRVSRGLRVWTLGPRLGPPPVLPVLVLSVLAASRMRRQGEVRSTNYYLRLAELLASNEDQVAPLRTMLSQRAFLQVVGMWRALAEWMRSRQGRVGITTIPQSPRPERIGYPLSQALVRKSDRAALTRFFAAMELNERELPPDEALGNSLRVWSHRQRLSEALRTAINDDDLLPIVASIIRVIAVSWDGVILAEEGKPHLQLRLAVDLDAWTTEWIVEYPAVDGTPAYVESVHVAGALEDALSRGIRHELPSGLGVFAPTDVLIFRRSPLTATWVSTSEGFAPFDEHVVAVTPDMQTRADAFMRTGARQVWKIVRQDPERALLPGRIVYERVQLVGENALQSALDALPSGSRRAFAPQTVARPKLTNGLPVLGELATAVYLVGGEPDLAIPFSGERVQTQISLDERMSLIYSTGFPLELRRFELPTGQHRVTVDGYAIAFQTVDANVIVPPQPKNTALGWLADAHLVEESLPEQVARGAYIRGAAPSSSMQIRRGAEASWWLIEGGTSSPELEPPLPVFLAHVGIDTSVDEFFEADAPIRAMWLAQQVRGLWRVRALDTPGGEINVRFNPVEMWSRVYQQDDASNEWAFLLGMSE